MITDYGYYSTKITKRALGNIEKHMFGTNVKTTKEKNTEEKNTEDTCGRERIHQNKDKTYTDMISGIENGVSKRGERKSKYIE